MTLIMYMFMRLYGSYGVEDYFILMRWNHLVPLITVHVHETLRFLLSRGLFITDEGDSLVC